MTNAPPNAVQTAQAKITSIQRVLSIGPVNAENVTPDQEIKPLIEASLGEYNRHF